MTHAKVCREPVAWLTRARSGGTIHRIGGAASGPVVAGAFRPSLAPVGVLLARFLAHPF
ncbi:MAG: DUF819 family protein [Alphaproteobacteria bacterium]|nr:DUF819 family protein [Alphaproteobacteria bacterium]